MKAYRLLLKLFPRRFRRRYGEEMEETFARLLTEARGGGPLAVALAWLRVAGDAVFRGGAERLRVVHAAVRGGDHGRGREGKDARGTVPGARGPRTRGGDPMGALLADVRYAVRSLLRRPLFLATAVVTLALGIGATTAIFSVVNGLLVRPLPYPEPEELVVLWAENRELGWSETDVNMADVWDYRARAGVFDDVAVLDDVAFNLTGGDRPERILAITATANLLDLLGASPALGRGLAPTDTHEGAPLVAILSHGFWTRRFARDPDVLDRTVVLDGEPARIVGVLPADFIFLDDRPDVFVPMRTDPAAAPRGSHNRQAVARLAAGVSVDEAREAVNRVALALQEEHPEQNRGWTAQVVGLKDELLGPIAEQAAFVLMGAVGFVLLMACTNVANLLLARGNGRRTELAVRAALGAGRGRIVRQLLVETGMMAVLGGALGLALAWAGERYIVAGLPADMPPVFRFGLDGTVLAFAVGVTVLAALLFGLLPAFRASSPAAAGLADAARGSAGRRSLRFGSFLVVAQTALAVVLLVGGGMMVRSVVGMARQDMGFEPDGVLTLRLSPPAAGYPERTDVAAFWDEALARVRSLPAVEAAGAIHAIPLGGANWGGTFWLGEEDPETVDGRPARFDYVTPGYLDAMGIEVVRGRDLTEADGVEGAAGVLVTEALVRRHMEGRDPLGARLRSSGLAEPVTVVGVVEDHLQRGIDEAPGPAILFPVAHRGIASRALVVRTTGDPAALVDAVEGEVRVLDPELPVYEVRTLNEVVRLRVGGFSLIAELMGAFAVVSLLLGAVGIYGVTAYGVGQRTREIGVRLAMGADRRSVVGMVVGVGLRRVVLGLVLGLGLAWLLSRAMTGLLVGVSPTDPVTFGGVTALLLVVGFLGCWLPARRASGVNPVRALAAD